MRTVSKVGLFAFVAMLPLLMAPTGGLPSRPMFQAVGIGAAPGIAGTMTINGVATGDVMQFQNAGNTRGYLRANGTGIGLFSASGGGGNGLFVDATGQLLLGKDATVGGTTISPNAAAGRATLNIQGTAGANGALLALSAGGTQEAYLYASNLGTQLVAGVGRNFELFVNSGTSAMAATSAGAVNFPVSVAVAGVPAVSGYGAVKATATARSSTTTLANDPDLTLTIAAGSYQFEMFLPICQAGGGNLKFTVATTASGTMNYTWINKIGVSAMVATSAWTTPNTFIATGITPNCSLADWYKFNGSFVATSGGTFGLQWAQNVSDALSSSIAAGAYLRMTKL